MKNLHTIIKLLCLTKVLKVLQALTDHQNLSPNLISQNDIVYEKFDYTD